MESGPRFAEILMLALLSGGVNSTDLVALAEPTAYFKSRDIDPSIDRLIDFVIAEPKTPKAQIRQLVSLRHLADKADAFKKAKNYPTNRLAIEEIAEGKRANDPQGFAQEYAQRILAELDGTKPALAKIRPLREDALDWFPADLSFAAALDLRQSGAKDTMKELFKMMPDRGKQDLYDQIERMGNLRIERVAFGLVDAKNPGDKKMFMRVTGKGNQAWVASMITNFGGENFQVRKSKDAAGTPILTLQSRFNPAILLIGDTELVVVGYEKHDGRHEEVVNEMLEVRAKKKPHAGTGLLKDRLAKIPDHTTALLVGDLPDEMKRSVGDQLAPFPSKISAYAVRVPKGFDVKIETTMANADEAGELVKKVGELRKQGIAALQQALKQPMPPGAAPALQAVISLMEEAKLENQGGKVQVRATVSDRLIQQLGQTMMLYAPQRFDDPPPPLKRRIDPKDLLR